MGIYRKDMPVSAETEVVRRSLKKSEDAFFKNEYKFERQKCAFI